MENLEPSHGKTTILVNQTYDSLIFLCIMAFLQLLFVDHNYIFYFVNSYYSLLFRYIKNESLTQNYRGKRQRKWKGNNAILYHPRKSNLQDHQWALHQRSLSAKLAPSFTPIRIQGPILHPDLKSRI